MTAMQAEAQRRERQVDPEQPEELWGLWCTTCWMRAMDETGEPILVYFTREAAEEGAQAHREYYELESEVRRIK